MPASTIPTALALLPAPIVASLRAAGLIDDIGWTASPLTGGISSDIFLVRPARGAPFVIKQALAKLRVKADWQADPGRNSVEHRWLARAATITPGRVPALLHTDDLTGYFAMEYLGDLAPWKYDLMKGHISAATAKLAGETLGRFHAASWGNAADREAFATGELFQALRIEPYLLATGQRHPTLQAYFAAEAVRLASTRLTLVHGDYSPKNLLVDCGRFVVVDAEVAWFGDPVFDVAFALNHLHLKALHHAAAPTIARACLRLGEDFVVAYADAMGARWTPEFEAHTARLLLMLMLARIDGKSPAEYLTLPGQHALVRRFVSHHLPHPPVHQTALTASWAAALSL